jgi:pyrimidine nucleoside transport protein
MDGIDNNFLRWNFGRTVIQCISNKATIFLSYSNNGSNFVYGYLVSDENAPGIALGSIFAFKVYFIAKFIDSINYIF